MTPATRAETRIAELGIRDPRDLDIEAIAFDSGVSVRYESLTGCEAMLVGFGSKAIATIKPSVRGRERFSIGHELGHWELHRGRSFRCRVDDPSDNLASDVRLEREADEFSSHLLMPGPLFNPMIVSLRWPSLPEIKELSDLFQSSVIATLIRIAHVDSLAVMVACYSGLTLRWWIAAPHIPKRWWLKKTLDRDTFAYDLVMQGSPCGVPRKQSADAWFENSDAGEFEVLEQCLPAHTGQVLVTLYFCDAEMFDRGFDPDVKWRK